MGDLEVCMPGWRLGFCTTDCGTFVLNLGDLIPRWTNGLYKSNSHRVRNLYSNGKSRYSIPFFYGPSYFKQIDALSGTIQRGELSSYTSCTAGEYMEEMYQHSFV